MWVQNWTQPVNSLDCRKTFLGHFHSETPNFFTALKHSENKKIH